MRRKLLVPILAILTVLALAGCVRFQADLSLNPDDTVDGSIVLAVVLGDDADAKENAAEAVANIETELLGGVSGAVGATRSEYDQDGYYGTRFSFDDTPIEAFDGASSEGSLRLTRDGDEFVFEGLLDFTPDDGEVAGRPRRRQSNITVKITFPGEVTEHNGELVGAHRELVGDPGVPRRDVGARRRDRGRPARLGAHPRARGRRPAHRRRRRSS